jgi:hypothetical protein
MQQYHTKISNRFAALDTASDGEGINSSWENFKEKIKISSKRSLRMYELKLLKPRFEEECLGFFRSQEAD